MHHYSTFFGATVLKEVLDICPYSSLLVVATKKRGIMAICWASLSRISNIHSKLEKKPREKHSVFSLVCQWIFVNTASRITAYCPIIILCRIEIVLCARTRREFQIHKKFSSDVQLCGKVKLQNPSGKVLCNLLFGKFRQSNNSSHEYLQVEIFSSLVKSHSQRY